MQSVLQQFITRIPQADLIFAYGSAVQPQASYDYTKSKPMVDLIIAVDDVHQWHSQNLQLNPNHYSGLSYYFGAKFIHQLNQQIFPIHFSPFIKFESEQIKYGVVDSKTLIRDLESWRWLTLAGRMHKPILMLKEYDNIRFQEAYKQNLQSALAIGLLIDFRSSMNMSDLLFNIMSLSYIGDIRFKLGGENQQKVANILQGNYDSISDLYLNNLGQLSNIITVNQNTLDIDTSQEALELLCSMMPQQLLTEYSGGGRDIQTSLKMMDLSKSREMLIDCIKMKNGYSSKRMLMYNMIAISPLYSMKYGCQKLMKRFNN